MRVKKFICQNCGAPKVTPIKNPYVVCDYCCSLIDIDYSVGINVWNQSAAHTNEYNRKKVIFESNSAQFVRENNIEAYKKEQLAYWDFYYQHYPEYLPPNISIGEKYEQFLKACVEITADSLFNPPEPTNANAYNLAYASLSYYQSNGQNLVTYDSFIKMIRAYNDYVNESYVRVYENPELADYQELMPRKIQAKVNLSKLAQVWVPYLKKEDADKFLHEFGLSHEYTTLKDPVIKQSTCENCHEQISYPEGAITCICEKCKHENTLKKVINCNSCGVENPIPKHWHLHINCVACGTELSVVQPMFG
jgi:hypothetical protein